MAYRQCHRLVDHVIALHDGEVHLWVRVRQCMNCGDMVDSAIIRQWRPWWRTTFLVLLGVLSIGLGLTSMIR